MAMLLGKKVGMTQVYDEAGKMLPVTVIELGPCVVTQVKTIDTDGYNAVQLGYEDVKESRLKKPQIGHAAKAKTNSKKFVHEMRLGKDEQPSLNAGDNVSVSVFAESKRVDVTSTSKGKGFAGVMKRHHFSGMPASHGCERMHRHGGAISSYASDRGHGGNLKKGKRMGGQMGNVTVTSKNHSLVSIDEERNLLVIKGSIPGPSGGYVVVRSSK